MLESQGFETAFAFLTNRGVRTMSIRRVLQCSTYLIASLALTGCLTPGPGPEPIAVAPLQLSADEEQIVDRVIIVTDASSSIYQEGFSQAKAMTQSVVAGLPADSGPLEVGAISFGGGERDIVPISALNRPELESYAAALQPLGGVPGYGGITPMDNVFNEISEGLNGRTGRTAVILISDGEATRPDRAIEAAESLIANYNGPMCIHTVQTGNSEKGAALAQELSGLTGCGSMQTAEQLRTAYDITSYERSVFAAKMSTLPDVAAQAPCESRMNLTCLEFAFDSAELTGASRDIVMGMATQLDQCKDVTIQIGGHADTTGNPGYNQQLSEKRANSVRSELINDGIDENRLKAIGFGDTEPVATNDSVDGRSQNRRVEFVPEMP
jgi:OOP family OmpA-OmpF porin